MTTTEIFPNPTVQKVIFQIQFPSLFSIENRIGDLQERIIAHFPESALLHQQRFIILDIGQQDHVVSPPGESKPVGKVWQFKSPKGYTMSVHLNSLDIVSELHKTYDNTSSENRFRDIIDISLRAFFHVFSLHKISRIGLRYIDECPVLKRQTSSFKRWYNSALPLSRFRLEDTNEMFFRTVSNRGKFAIIYQEIFSAERGKWKYTLDFDGFAIDVDATKCLDVTDELHAIIRTEWLETIREPVKTHMRRRQGDKT